MGATKFIAGAKRNTTCRVDSCRIDRHDVRLDTVKERDTMHGVNKRHLSPGIALHFAFYALRSLGRFMPRFMLHTERDAPFTSRMCA